MSPTFPVIFIGAKFDLEFRHSVAFEALSFRNGATYLKPSTLEGLVYFLPKFDIGVAAPTLITLPFVSFSYVEGRRDKSL